jgi:hypothetical protein
MDTMVKEGQVEGKEETDPSEDDQELKSEWGARGSVSSRPCFRKCSKVFHMNSRRARGKR